MSSEYGGLDWAESGDLFARSDPAFKTWTDHQMDAFRRFEDPQAMRSLLFFPTGKGKTKTALAMLAYRGQRDIVVIAPLRTHDDWKKDAAILGLNARVETHQKFRMEASKYRKDTPFIVDEFHMLGGHTGKGWRKLNRMAVRLQAEIIMASATPNYNDAERVFCITAIADDEPNRNYLNWLIENFETKPNYFSAIPDVVKPRYYNSALEMLVDKPYTSYIEDDAVWKSEELRLSSQDLDIFERYGYSHRHHRIVASDMEKRHKRIDYQYITDTGLIHNSIMQAVFDLFSRYHDRKKWLVFCNHKTVAEAFYASLSVMGWQDAYLVTGDTSEDEVERTKKSFRVKPERAILIGTSTLATGVDGIDKVCQSLLILDDIEGDPSLRRQLIGRILSRGTDDGIERLVVTATI